MEDRNALRTGWGIRADDGHDDPFLRRSDGATPTAVRQQGVNGTVPCAASKTARLATPSLVTNERWTPQFLNAMTTSTRTPTVVTVTA